MDLATRAGYSTLLLLSVVLIAHAKVDTSKFRSVTELDVQITHKPSSCTTRSKAGDHLTVHYTGYLVNGKVTDSSLSRNIPWEFVLGNEEVLEGFDLGLYGACAGEKRLIHIPPQLAYGDVGSGELVPPKSTVIYDVEVVKIKTKEALADEADPFDEYEEGDDDGLDALEQGGSGKDEL